MVLELDFDATTPYVYRFYVVDAGQTPDIEHPIEYLVTDRYKGTRLEWAEAMMIQINCLPGTVYSWNNKVSVAFTEVKVEVDSRCTH